MRKTRAPVGRVAACEKYRKMICRCFSSETSQEFCRDDGALTFRGIIFYLRNFFGKFNIVRREIIFGTQFRLTSAFWTRSFRLLEDFPGNFLRPRLSHQTTRKAWSSEPTFVAKTALKIFCTHIWKLSAMRNQFFCKHEIMFKSIIYNLKWFLLYCKGVASSFVFISMNIRMQLFPLGSVWLFIVQHVNKSTGYEDVSAN